MQPYPHYIVWGVTFCMLLFFRWRFWPLRWVRDKENSLMMRPPGFHRRTKSNMREQESMEWGRENCDVECLEKRTVSNVYMEKRPWLKGHGKMSNFVYNTIVTLRQSGASRILKYSKAKCFCHLQSPTELLIDNNLKLIYPGPYSVRWCTVKGKASHNKLVFSVPKTQNQL